MESLLSEEIVPLIVWGAITIVTLIFIIYFFVFRFHWKYYGLKQTDRRFALTTFAIISFILIIMAVSLALMYQATL